MNPVMIVGAAAAAAYFLLRKSGDSKNGSGLGSGTPGEKNLDLCGAGPHEWNDKQRAKVRKAILEEVDRAGARNWSGMSELDEKTFQVVRAMTLRFCPKWPIPDARYQLPGFLENGSQAFRDWWEHLEIGVRREVGGWVT